MRSLAFATVAFSIALPACGRAFELPLGRSPLPIELAIVTETLPVAERGIGYHATLRSRGGEGTARVWSLRAGNLPAGLSVQSSGSISGTPDEIGQQEIVVAVQDEAGDVATRAFTLEVRGPPLRIVTDSLPPGAVGQLYEQDIVAEGGAPPYRWTPSVVPPGLAIDSDGLTATLRGVPARTGRFNVQLRIDDDTGQADSASLVVVVEDEIPLEILTESLPNANPNQRYRAVVEATPNLGPYRWRIVRGALPAGLDLRPSSVSSVEIDGVARGLGSATFDIEVQDALGRVARRELTIDVTGRLVITTASIDPGSECAELEALITAEGGSGSGYIWSVVQGNLPPGVQIVRSRTPATLVFGTPRTAGTYPVRIRVVDDGGNEAVRNFDILVTAATTPRFGLMSAIEDGNGVVYALDVCTPVPTLVGPLSPPPAPGVRVGTADGLAIVGDKAVYGLERGSGYAVYVVDLRGNVPSQVTVADALATPTFSPDGQSLALAGELEFDGRRAIYVVDVSDPANPTTPRRVSPIGPPGSRASGVAWSPDSTKIAFTGDLNVVGFTELFVVDVTTAVAAPEVVSGMEGGGSPVWTTDSTRVVYRPTDRLYLAGLGVAPRTLTTPALTTHGEPFTSPDGRWATYYADINAPRSFFQFVIDLQNVTATPVIVGQPLSNAPPTIRFGPRSMHLATTVSSEVDGSSLYVSRLASPGAATIIGEYTSGLSFNVAFARTVDALAFPNDGTMQWIDLSGPAPGMPIALGGLRSGARPFPARDSDRIFVRANDGVHMADMSDPMAPAILLTGRGRQQVRTVAPTARGLTLFYGQGTPTEDPYAVATVGPNAGMPMRLGPPGTYVRRFLLP